MNKKILLSLYFILLFHTAFAIEYRRQFQDYRSLGMGNTGIASANNSATLFYNPAALANITDGWVDIPAIQATYSPEASAIYAEIQKGGFLETTEDQLAFMEEYMGKKIYVQVDAGINAFINLDKKGTTIGGNYMVERILDFDIQNPALPEIAGFERYDQMKLVGFSYPIGLGQFVLGLGAQTLIRKERSYVFTTTQALAGEAFPSIALTDVADGSSDTGTGYDVGFLFRFASPYRVVLAGVWRSGISMDEATDIPPEAALGFTMAHEFGPFKWVMAIDVRDLTQEQGSEGDKSWARRIHGGMEFAMFPTSDLNYLLTVRGGYNQGYKSLGAEFRLGNSLVIGVAQFSEEVGEFAGDKENKRTAAYVSLGF
ncbi:MAG: hypothetical protein HOD92_02560 [Deltaproteobacteria bacterium]|jgi:hypothetical protein|nr:hypothetical protein [Deltaproteobacteria bacterium]MBT4527351.1 hypothetical protein [Deltaproteobacteria bacterium]